MHGEGVRLVVGLPRRGGAVLVVGVGVVVVDVLPRQDGGAGRAAHGRRGEGIGEMCAALLHDVPGFVHCLHGAWGVVALRDIKEKTIQRPRTAIKGAQRDIRKMKRGIRVRR